MSDLRYQYESTSRLELEKNYSLDGNGIPTGQTKQDYQLITDHITKYKPKCIIEYGSGYSTRVIQKTIDELDLKTKFFSFEDNKHFYDVIKNNIELTDSVQLCPIEKAGDWGNKDKLARYYHDYKGMEDVDFVIIDGPDVGRYNIYATINVDDLHERFPNNKINVFIQGRKSTTEYYISKYGDKFKFIGKNGWGTL